MQDIMQMISVSWPILLMIAIFYFIIYRPQKKQQQQRSELLRALKKGDKVITIGGIHGTITAINATKITLKVSDKVEITFARESISRHQSSEPNSSDETLPANAE